jgi:phosphatidate cytidylyltransferase
MKRLLTAAVLIPFILYVVYLGQTWLLFGVTALVALICFSEYSGLAAGYGVTKPGPVGYAAGLLVLAMKPEDGYLILTLVAIIALSLVLRLDDLRQALPHAAFLLFGIVYIFGAWKFAILLRAASPHWLAFALILNWVGDGFAYYIGKSFGRHPLATKISPNKTWEGSIASLVGSMLFGVFYLNRTLSVPIFEGALLTAAANIAGQAGDLAESALKRGANVKDSGSLLPGHGGLLDRVDSTLFALPVVYLKLYFASLQLF